MFKTVFISLWALFVGIGLIMAGNGLQGSLLGIRAELEGFSTIQIGIVMTLYYVGYLLGTTFIKKYILAVGHIRVFAAMASLASVMVLAHSFLPHVWAWAVIRVFTGFSFAGLYIVIESWLNSSADNKSRGKVLGIYMVINYAGLMGGQFLLNLSDPMQHDLFVLISVLISLALIPISLSRRPGPIIHDVQPMSVMKLKSISPIGFYGVLVSGLCASTFLSLGTPFFMKSGFQISDIATLMALCIFGGVVFQYPFGWLSDRIDRRTVILGVSLFASMAAFACSFYTTEMSPLLYVLIFLLGGGIMPIYGLSAAHLNDHLASDQIIAASASIILISAIGACLGPVLASVFMDVFSEKALFLFLAVIQISIFAFASYRKVSVEPVPVGEKRRYVNLPMRMASEASFIIRKTREEIRKRTADKKHKHNGNGGGQ